MVPPLKNLFRIVRYSRIASFGFFLLIILLDVGCGNKKSDESTGLNEENAEQVRDEVLKTIQESGVTRLFSSAGSVFQQEALHDITQTHHYLQQGNKGVAAINLGVYMSDLGYLMDFNKREDAKPYFEGCFLLANHVGLKKQFSRAVELRFSEIISGNEVLEKSLNKLFKNAENTSEEFKKMHAAALTGYYIEELYHLVIFVQSSPSDENASPLLMKAVQTLVNQKQEVNNLIGYFDHLQLRPEGIALYQDFLKMQAKYMALDSDRLLKTTDFSAIQKDQNFADILNSIISIRMTITDL